jgi:hypothetical protein
MEIPMTTPDIAGQCKALRAVESSRGPSDWSGIREVTTNWYRNPDGPPAADTLERQAAEIERLRGALKPFVVVLEHDISADADGTDWFTPMTSNNRAPRLVVSDFRAARAALTGEDTCIS